MKIGLDARLYGPKNGGIGRYLQKLLENLEEIYSENQYVIFLRRENWDECQPRNPNFKKVLADFRPYSLKEQILMPGKIRREKIDLMHFPHFNIPIFYPCLFGRQAGKFVVTIHDLIPLRFSSPETSTLNPLLFRLKRLMMKLTLAAAVKKSVKIIAVSEYTKNDILRFFKVKEDKIKVVYEGVPDSKFKIQNAKCKVTIQNSKLFKNLKINQPYILYVGAAYPHKNLEKLLEAFQKLLTLHSSLSTLKLVLAGKDDIFYQRIKQRAKDLGLENQVAFAGFVSDENLPELYQNAALYVFPSLCEGFGLPPLEAMSYGVPVISSNASCLPEILGDAAEYFNPESAEEMTESIAKVLSESDLREKLKSRGQERLRAFNWRKMAAETGKIYQLTANF